MGLPKMASGGVYPVSGIDLVWKKVLSGWAVYGLVAGVRLGN